MGRFVSLRFPRSRALCWLGLAGLVAACSPAQPEPPAAGAAAPRSGWRLAPAPAGAPDAPPSRAASPAARPPVAPPPPAKLEVPGWEILLPYLEGEASWYGPGFHGRRTANGEVYNQYALTAAHPMLPLGTQVEVVNLDNRRRVWVRINDRGPYAKGRILDLSRVAAEYLGLIGPGTARVRIAVVRWPDSLDARLGLEAYRQWVVQVAAYPEPERAEARRQDLQERFGSVPFFIDRTPGGRYAVVAGPYGEEDAGRQVAGRLRHHGYAPLVRSYRK